MWSRKVILIISFLIVVVSCCVCLITILVIQSNRNRVEIGLREQARINLITNIGNQLEDSYFENGEYPNSKEVADLISNSITDKIRYLQIYNTTLESATRYCYSRMEDNFGLGVMLESKEWYYYSRGTTAKECELLDKQI